MQQFQMQQQAQQQHFQQQMAMAEQVGLRLRAEVKEAQDSKDKVVVSHASKDGEIDKLRSELHDVAARCKEEVKDEARVYELKCTTVESETKSRAELEHRRILDNMMSEASQQHNRVVADLRTELAEERGRDVKTSSKQGFLCPECPKKHAEILRLNDEMVIKDRNVHQLAKAEESLRTQLLEERATICNAYFSKG